MSTLIIEKAKLKNLKDLIYLLFDDDLGKDRENISETSFNNYKKSFMKISLIAPPQVSWGVGGGRSHPGQFVRQK